MIISYLCKNLLHLINRFIHRKKVLTIPPAFKRHPEYFQLTDCVISQLHEWIDRGDHEIPKTALGYCKMATIIRAYNIYKSINILLRNDHWEDAAILTRSMFELLLNLEEVVKEEKNAEELSKKYLRFQKLQEYLHKISEINYEIKTGRRPSTELIKIEELKKLSKELFREFLDKNKVTGWASSWCGKSIYQLAKDSRNPMHIHNYEILYSFFSDITHSGPTAVHTSFQLFDNKDDAIKASSGVNGEQKSNLLMVLILSTTWLIEVLLKGGQVLIIFDPRFCLKVTEKIKKLCE